MPLSDYLDQLSAFEPTPLPVISLYLNAQADQHGRDNFEPFVRKEFAAVARTFESRSPERRSFEADAERIRAYLKDDVKPSSNGLAIFACAGKDEFFVPVQFDAPIERNQLYVGNQPHLYTLAKISDQYRSYAAVIADTNSARIFVFGMMKTIDRDRIESAKISRTQMGGWSQARYQRHVENYYLKHVKEVVDALDRIVREENIEQIFFAGDEVVIPIIRDQLPAHLSRRVADILRIDVRTPEWQIIDATLEAMREHDAKSDAELVNRLFDQYRAGGLAVVGLQRTLTALDFGQVDRLLLSASMDDIRADTGENTQPFTPAELVARAKQTGAEATFIEDSALLAGVGGVGAMLRFPLYAP